MLVIAIVIIIVMLVIVMLVSDAEGNVRYGGDDSDHVP